MPLKRYLLVKGALDPEGHPLPVTNPHAGAAPTGSVARYVGLKLVADPPKDPDHLGDIFEPCQELIEDHPDLRRAIKDKCLEQLGEVSAKTRADAQAAAEELKRRAAREKGGPDNIVVKALTAATTGSSAAEDSAASGGDAGGKPKEAIRYTFSSTGGDVLSAFRGIEQAAAKANRKSDQADDAVSPPATGAQQHEPAAADQQEAR